MNFLSQRVLTWLFCRFPCPPRIKCFSVILLRLFVAVRMISHSVVLQKPKNFEKITLTMSLRETNCRSNSVTMPSSMKDWIATHRLRFVRNNNELFPSFSAKRRIFEKLLIFWLKPQYDDSLVDIFKYHSKMQAIAASKPII